MSNIYSCKFMNNYTLKHKKTGKSFTGTLIELPNGQIAFRNHRTKKMIAFEKAVEQWELCDE